MSALDAIGPVCGHAIDQDVANAASNASINASDLLDQELGRKLETPLDERGEIVLAQLQAFELFRFSYPADHGQALHDWIEEEFALAVDEEKVFQFWDDVKSKGSTRSETLNNTDNLYYVWRIVDHRRHAAAPNHEPGELKEKATPAFIDTIPGSLFNDYLACHNLTRMLRTRKKTGRKPKAKARNGSIAAKQHPRRSSVSVDHRNQSDESTIHPNHGDVPRSPSFAGYPGIGGLPASGHGPNIPDCSSGCHQQEASILSVAESPRGWSGPGLRVNMMSGQIEYNALTATGTSYADETSLINQINDMRLSPESALAEKTIQVEILGRELRRQAEQSVEERRQAFEDREKFKVAETETRRLSMQLDRANGYIAELEARNSMLRQQLQRADVQVDG
ncbi:hypothetical protein COL154_012290 [Colletotrichum chrysophilum]|nr:uncharacterized protein COL26b_013645 [Colletotrichum chrysophilum]KAJ0352997.1 hypothetical protein COL154_012290 [Colletotrichum chrysophilum]KAJ0361671.1 hypothetical protein COL26b_013645 [Colletotrichum chrysophilum]